MENVSAILSNGLGTVLGDLAALGYVGRTICLRASDVGANHHRDRWWLLARRNDANTRLQGVLEYGRDAEIGKPDGYIRGIFSDVSQATTQEEKSDIRDVRHPQHAGQPTSEITGSIAQGSDHNATGAQQAEQPARSGEQCADVAYAESEESSGLPIGKKAESAEHGNASEDVSDTNTTGLQRLNGSEEERESSETQRQFGQLSGDESGQIKSGFRELDDGMATEFLQSWWEVEPNVGRVTDVTKDRAAQLKCLGNGQVPLQAAVAFSMLMELFA